MMKRGERRGIKGAADRPDSREKREKNVSRFLDGTAICTRRADAGSGTAWACKVVDDAAVADIPASPSCTSSVRIASLFCEHASEEKEGEEPT